MVIVIKKLLIIIFFVVFSQAALSEIQSKSINHDYIKSSTGIISFDGSGNLFIQNIGISKQSGNVVFKADYWFDIIYDLDISAMTLGVGYLLPVSETTEVVMGVTYVSLSASNNSSTASVDDLSFDLTATSRVSDSTTIHGLMSIGSGGVGFSFGGSIETNTFIDTIRLTYTPAVDGISSTEISFLTPF